MKKTLSLLLMLGLVLGISGFVSAVDQPTTITVGSGEITFVLTPNTLDFGSQVLPGTTAPSTAPITFSVTDGNVDVILTVTSVTGDSLFNGIEVRNTGSPIETPWTNIVGKSDVVECTPSGDPAVCTYPETLSWDARLPIPSKLLPDTYDGVVVYTVTGPAPPLTPQ